MTHPLPSPARADLPAPTPGNGMIGVHVLADFYGVSATILQDVDSLSNLLLRALREAGFRVLDHCKRKFPGDDSGVSVIALLAESHATIHTYPEYQYLAIDLFSCGDADIDHVLTAFQNACQPTSQDIQRIRRGQSLSALDD